MQRKKTLPLRPRHLSPSVSFSVVDRSSNSLPPAAPSSLARCHHSPSLPLNATSCQVSRTPPFPTTWSRQFCRSGVRRSTGPAVAIRLLRPPAIRAQKGVRTPFLLRFAHPVGVPYHSVHCPAFLCPTTLAPLATVGDVVVAEFHFG
ncbi:unnamed protein product, partial [Citrullus colocynthis]